MTGTFFMRVGRHPDKCRERQGQQKPDWARRPVRLVEDSSEFKLHRKLNQTRVGVSVVRRDYTKSRCAEAGRWGSKLGMIEEVEELGPELQTKLFVKVH